MDQASTVKVPTCIGLPPALRERMDAAAAIMERPRSWIATKAIEQFLSGLAPLPTPPVVLQPPAEPRVAALVREANADAATGFALTSGSVAAPLFSLAVGVPDG